MDAGVWILLGVIALALGALVGWLLGSRQSAAAKQVIDLATPDVQALGSFFGSE